MNNINIIPVLLEDADSDKINLDRNFKIIQNGSEKSFNASVMFFTNGVMKESYNIYSILSNTNRQGDISSLLLGGFSIEGDSFYNNSSRLNFSSPIFPNMKKEFMIEIYMIRSNRDEHKSDLTDGFFKQLSMEGFDLNFILENGVKISETTFYLNRQVN